MNLSLFSRMFGDKTPFNLRTLYQSTTKRRRMDFSRKHSSKNKMRTLDHAWFGTFSPVPKVNGVSIAHRSFGKKYYRKLHSKRQLRRMQFS